MLTAVKRLVEIVDDLNGVQGLTTEAGDPRGGPASGGPRPREPNFAGRSESLTPRPEGLEARTAVLGGGST